MIKSLKKFFGIKNINHCPRCKQRFSDWFVWSDGRSYCFPCYDNWKDLIREKL